MGLSSPKVIESIIDTPKMRNVFVALIDFFFLEILLHMYIVIAVPKVDVLIPLTSVFLFFIDRCCFFSLLDTIAKRKVKLIGITF